MQIQSKQNPTFCVWPTFTHNRNKAEISIVAREGHTQINVDCDGCSNSIHTTDNQFYLDTTGKSFYGGGKVYEY